MNMKGKVIWITGASSGIGEALVHEAAATGAYIVVSSRRRKELQRVIKQAGIGERSAILVLDQANPEKAAETTGKFFRSHRVPDVFILNGGISQRSLATDTDYSVDEMIMKVNYLSNIAMLKEILPVIRDRGHGSLVVISSVVGKIGTPYRSAYAASKHALHGFFDSLRAELPGSIHVGMVCPGFIRTNVSVNALTEKGKPLGIMDNAQKNGMDPRQCARIILRAVQSRKREVFAGGFREGLALWMARFFPGILARMLRKVQVR